ncbi:MAG: tRNA pseudouridine(38-40) synthase TruA [Ignavibacteria bacterium]|nr:tRNA pseudouridine(38-40) synthase TruA [Ignavibacteria bacterium]MBI3766469.1 tRNA pseudouridine(38-40) synthase TruA [Ignavibacteriales bacterium]
MRNIKLLIEYDGTNYVGWQRQENGKSIQGEIESVLQRILQERVNVIGAGRTDAGVHARGQVANFRTETKRSSQEMLGAFNALLPEDIVIHEIEQVPLEFHARYSARERRYSYLLTKTPTALQRQHSWYVKYELEIDLMKRAAEAITGTHDFESFCKANSDVEHYRCTVTSASWNEEGTLLQLTISADRFLHGMVRALVGTMVDVGRGYISFDEFLRIFEKKNRTEAGMAAPAKGLVLEAVMY